METKTNLALEAFARNMAKLAARKQTIEAPAADEAPVAPAAPAVDLPEAA